MYVAIVFTAIHLPPTQYRLIDKFLLIGYTATTMYAPLRRSKHKAIHSIGHPRAYMATYSPLQLPLLQASPAYDEWMVRPVE